MSAVRPGVSRGFGALGWRMIVVSTFMYFIYAGWSADGINVFSTALSKANGWDEGRILTLVAPGGLMGVVGAAVFSQMIMRFGTRTVMTVCLVGFALAIYWFGHMSALWEFAVVFMLMNLFGAGFGFVAPGTLLAHWFPRKKGMALAIATCGFPLSTALFVPLIAVMFTAFGIGIASGIWAYALLAMAGIAFLVVRNTPEEVGAQPDNELSKKDADTLAGVPSSLTVWMVLKDARAWYIGVGWGALWMVTVGIVVQLVPRLMATGYTESGALAMLSTAAICAVPGSVLWGHLDGRFGTRIATQLYACLYVVTLPLLMASQRVHVLVLPAVFLVGVGLGGIKSLLTSMVATVYGRIDFSAAYRVILPTAIVVRTLCFPVLGFSLSVSGSLDLAYMIFMIVDVLALFLVLRIRQISAV